MLPITIIEEEWNQLTPRDLAQQLVPPFFHYLPQDLKQTRTFYEFILVDTDSIEVTHHTDKDNNIVYSKLKILKIITISEWNQPTYKPKSLSRQFTPQTYTYNDYKDAWCNMFYYKPYQHSWFIWFKRGISLKFPKWFLKWYFDFGPFPLIFPQEVDNSFKYFKEKTNFV